MEEKKDQNRNNHRKTLLILAIAVALAVVVAIILSSQSSVRLNKLLKDGENYLDSENYEAAEYSFESALTIDPNNDKAKTKLADTYTAWAKALSDGKDYEQAVMVLDRASDTFGKDDEITSVVKETYTNWVDNLEDDGNQLLAAQITKRAGKNGVTLESSTAETDVQEPDTDNVSTEETFSEGETEVQEEGGDTISEIGSVNYHSNLHSQTKKKTSVDEYTTMVRSLATPGWINPGSGAKVPTSELCGYGHDIDEYSAISGGSIIGVSNGNFIVNRYKDITYDKNNRIHTMTYESGCLRTTVLTCTYRKDGLLDHVDLVSTFEDEGGQKQKQKETLTYVYDDDGAEPVLLSINSSSGDNCTFEYDDNARLTKLNLEGESISFAYNEDGSIARGILSFWDILTDYDWETMMSPEQYNMIYDKKGRLTRAGSHGGTYVFFY